MAQYSEEVKKLAETLKNSGLAASMVDALERAQRMIGKKEEKKEIVEEPIEKIDATQTTLDDVKGEVTIEEASEEEVMKKEEVFAKPVEEKKEEPVRKANNNQKKIDLSDIFNVNK